MDRVPYRRVTPPRGTAKTRSNKEVITRGETLIMQFVVGGILFLTVLMICLIDIAPMVTLRSGIDRILSGATTIEEFASNIRSLEEWISPIQPSSIIEQPGSTIEQLPVISPPIQPTNPPTVYEELSNPQNPGPLVVPGLWD